MSEYAVVHLDEIEEASCESLAGHTADAIEHLRQAVERSERLRSFAEEDSDLDPIRDEPAFKELIDR